MNNKVLQHTSRIQSSKSNLRLRESANKSYADAKEENFSSPQGRPNAKSNIKARAIADLLSYAKESSYERRLAKKSPDDRKNIQNSPKKTRNLLLESSDVSLTRHFSPTSTSLFKLCRERYATSNISRANRTRNAISPLSTSKRELNSSGANHSLLNRTLRESNSSQLHIPPTSENSTRVRCKIPRQHYTERVLDQKFLSNDQPKLNEDIKYTKKIEKVLEPFDASFEFAPLEKQNLTASRKNLVSIVPSNSPTRTNNKTHDFSEERLSIGTQPLKNTIKKERKVPLLHYDIPIGKEVILVNNQTTCSTAVTVPSNRSPSRNRGHIPVLKLQKTRTSSGNQSLEEISLTKSKELQIEEKIEALLSDKSVDEAHIHEINNFFDMYVEKTAENPAESEFRRHKDVLKKIKLAYEIFFKNYFANMQRQKEKLSTEKTELSLQNAMLRAQLNEYGDVAKLGRANSSCENPKSTANTHYEQITRSNHTPTPPEMLSANKKNLADQLDSPLMTNKIESLDHERETLQSIITSQQSQINALMQKNLDFVRLVEVCNSKGIDILRIYREEVNREFGDLEDLQVEECDTPIRNKKELSIKIAAITKPEQSKNRQDLTALSSEPSSPGSVSQIGTERESRDNLSDQLLCDDDLEMKQKQLDLNPSLKSKLKLDFTNLKNKNMQSAGGLGLNLSSVKSGEEPVGFHQEFMARIDEFSLSWRQAAQKERKIP